MWTVLQDCGKQLRLHSRLREKLPDGYRVYAVTEVEYDQYHLQLLSKNELPSEDTRQVVTGDQLIRFGFEVEIKEEVTSS